MTQEPIEFKEMRLSGYVKLTEQGFALPAYAVRPGANAWYLAMPAVEGDHTSTIVGFELLENEDIHPLPDSTKVSLGAPWQDVFLWAGNVFTGTPSQIFDALSLHRDQLRVLAPLSYLDLAVAAEAPLTSELATEALTFLEARLGEADGAASFRELVIRPGVLIALQRQYQRIGHPRLPTTLHDFIVREYEPGQFEVKMAPGAAAIHGGEPAIAELCASIARLGDILGLPLRIVGLSGTELGPAYPEIPFGEPPPTPSFQPEDQKLPIAPFPNILIIAADRRAAQIAKYLEPPRDLAFDAQSIWGTEAYRVEHVRQINRFPNSPHEAIICVVDTIDHDTPLKAFGVVVWLAGNDALSDGTADAILSAMRPLRPDIPFLIAPAPPADGPSNLLGHRDDQETILRQCDAVIDTTLARSPFWIGQLGQPRRSVDRRMADIVAIVSTVSALSVQLRRKISTTRGSSEPRTLSLFGGRGKYSAEQSTVSELNATGLSHHPNGNHHARLGFEIRHKSSTQAQNAFLDLLPLLPNFQQFAKAAVFEALNPGGRWTEEVSERREIPAFTRGTLDEPDLAAVVQATSRPSRQVVITAEAPYVRTLREAQRERAAVVRYTDVDSLRAAMERHDDRRLPREIRLPTLHRYPRSRGLATRGVDTRDVFRLPEIRWTELLRNHPNSDLEEQVRRYLPAIDVRNADREIALPSPAVWNAVNAGDSLAKALVNSTTDYKRGRTLVGKRTGDLIAAWSQPARGVRRWVLEDGRIPVEVAALEPDSVPAQRLFFIDGDDAVPVFLMSRLFEVWAHALLPNSTSWTSRFQVSKTFDAFPFPWSFTVFPSINGSPPYLRFSEKNKDGEILSKLIEKNPQDFSETVKIFTGSDDAMREHPLIHEIDTLLLRGYHLPPDASDLDILEVLIERNREHA